MSGSEDGSLAVWDLVSGQRLHTIKGHQASVSSVAAIPDSRRVVSGSDDGTVAVWDLESGTRIQQLSAEHGRVTSVAVSPNGRCIVSACDDGCVVVEIGDNGPGIPPDIQPHIFEPFFTTKGVGEGTGLGLDTVQRIVRKHQGNVHVTSVPGDTRFQVLLPVAEGQKISK